MKYGLYSIKDEKVGFTPPQCDQSDQSAIRGFSFALNNKDNIMNYSPADFQLYKIGEFDVEKGKVIPLVPIELVCSGSSVIGDK